MVNHPSNFRRELYGGMVMLEIPESLNLAKQINETITGKQILSVTTEHTPHKLAWYYGDKTRYSNLLTGKTIEKARAYGSLVEIKAGNTSILIGEGVGVRFQGPRGLRPAKHQLLIEFEDGSAISATVQMYGGMGAFPEGTLNNPYYKVAKEKPSPLSSEFDETYFERLISNPAIPKLSLKAFLATEQRIPGLGNGVLQDILFNAKMHPRRKVSALSGQERLLLFNSLKSTLIAMTNRGGRDTELDLFGRNGKYITILSKNTVNKPCQICETLIKKEAYLGGTIYYCEKCQKM
jgi:formamidopyrimidine-DNA glycosylase